VDVLDLRDPDKLYEKGKDMIFNGFAVKERNVADSEKFEKEDKKAARRRK
jgi:hypothetical protein